MRFHMIRTSAALAVCGGVLLTPASLASGPRSYTIMPLVLEGDSVVGVGQVTAIDNVAVNNTGQWLVEADTNNPNTDADSILLRNGVLVMREGDPVSAPAGATLDSFDSVTITDGGHSGFNFFLDGTNDIFDDSGVYAFLGPGSDPFTDPVLVVQESQPAPGLTKGTLFIGFFDVKINNADQLFVTASVDDPNIPTSVDRALYILESDPQRGGITGFEMFAAEGDILRGQSEVVADFGTGPHASAFNDLGQVLLFADLAGSTATDGTIYFYDGGFTLLAQEGSASPVTGRNWLSLSGPEMDLNNHTEYVFSGSLDGDAATNLLIVKNGEKFIQEGDTLPAIGGVFTFTSFGSGPIEISDSGDVLWYGDWDDPNTDTDTGLFLEDTLLVQEGVTAINGDIVDTLRGITDGYHMSNNGRFIVFEAVLQDGTEGAFLIEFEAACPWDLNGSDSVNVLDLLALLAAWGPCQVCPPRCGFDGDCTIGIIDLLILLANWGDCP